MRRDILSIRFGLCLVLCGCGGQGSIDIPVASDDGTRGSLHGEIVMDGWAVDLATGEYTDLEPSRKIRPDRAGAGPSASGSMPDRRLSAWPPLR